MKKIVLVLMFVVLMNNICTIFCNIAYAGDSGVDDLINIMEPAKNGIGGNYKVINGITQPLRKENYRKEE